MPRLEIAITTLDDARNAEAGGADSVEISENLSVGGLTPPLTVVEAIIKNVRLNIHVLVRPHAKSFQYSAADIDQILQSIERLKAFPIKSIVFGAQDAARRIDLSLVQTIQTASAPIPLTIHRALDLSIEPEQSLGKLAEMGIRRILTSGPGANVWDARQGLARWIERFGKQFSFVASGGIQLEYLPTLVPLLKAPEYHFGSAARTSNVVDVKKVQQLRVALTK